MFGHDGRNPGIKRVLLLASVLITLKISEAIHETYFNGLQEIENVRIEHKLRSRSRRQIAVGSRAIPDIISTEVRGDAHIKTFLKFRRKRDTVISPVLTFSKQLNRLVNENTNGHCLHIYEGIGNSAHAVVDRCSDSGFIKMVAEVVLNNETHVILPKGSENGDYLQQHGLFKINNTIDFAHDYRTLSIASTDTRLPNVNHRLRRQTDREYVEMMFVVDYSLYQFWYRLTKGTTAEREAEALDFIQRMYAFTGNGVNLRFEDLKTSYDIDLDVELTGIYVLKTAEESPFTEYGNVDFTFIERGVVDADTLLNSFKSWLADQKVSNPTSFPQNDHYMLLTGREIVLSGNAAAAGYAYYTSICTSQSLSIVEDKFNFLSVVTAAHELGHSLGGVHDGETGGLCKDEDGYILSSINAVYTDSRATHPWKFSPCSANAFATTLRNLETSTNNCLRMKDTPAILLPTGKPPGQEFPPDEQCRLMLDSQSVMWRQRHVSAPDRMCTAMACSQLEYTKLTFVIPADGTTCGDKKWCWNGKCVYSDEAPAAGDESCLYGDQSGTVIDGVTCEKTLSGDSIWKCYQTNVQETCCGTCKAAQTGIEGCAYGDISVCTAISASQCYNSNTAKSCCETCYNKAKPYTNLTADCKYGDKKANCVRSPSICQQYLSDCCATCDGFTTPSSTSSTTITTPTSAETTKTTGATAGTQRSTEVTKSTQEPVTKPPEEKKDGLPKWVLYAAGGAGGVIGLSVLIGVCCCCMKQTKGDKYKDRDRRRRSNGNHRRSDDDTRRMSEDNRRRSNDNRRPSEDNRRRSNDRRESEDNRRRSDDYRRGSEDNRRRSDDYRRGSEDNRRRSDDSRTRSNNLNVYDDGNRRNMRRASEDIRRARGNYNRRPSDFSSRY